MKELQDHVERLFAKQQQTAETEELKAGNSEQFGRQSRRLPTRRNVLRRIHRQGETLA